MQPEKIIGRNIKTIREQKGLKLESLAKHLGISKGRVSQIENGHCKELNLARIGKISEFLKVNFFEVVSNKNDALNGKYDNTFNEWSYALDDLPPGFIIKIVDELINRMHK